MSRDFVLDANICCDRIVVSTVYIVTIVFLVAALSIAAKGKEKHCVDKMKSYVRIHLIRDGVPFLLQLMINLIKVRLHELYT